MDSSSTLLLDLIDTLAARGVTLRVEAGNLRVRGPAGELGPDLRARIAEHKPALVALLGGRDTSEPTPRPRDGDLPLSSAQARLWFVVQLSPESSAAYNIVAPVRIQGALRGDVLQRALAEIVRRHESLRTAFVSAQGRPVQRILPDVDVPLGTTDVSGLEPAAREAAVAAALHEEATTSFDLEQPPLLRARLLRTAADEHVLVFAIHHMVSDDWSSGVLVREVGALYDAFAAGRPSPLPPLAIQYADYVLWHREWLSGDVLRRHLDYWKSALAGVTPLVLPTDRPRPAVQTFSGASETFTFPKALAEKLGGLAQREGVTLFMTLLAGFSALLLRQSGQTDVAIGSAVANRNRHSLEPLIGFLTNTLVFRTDLSGNPTFREVLQRVKEMARGAYEHQELPFEALVEELQPERTLSHNPLFQVCFSLLQAHRDTLRLGELALTQMPMPAQASRFDLTLTMEDADDGLLGTFEYNTDLFDAVTIRRMVRQLHCLLEAFAVDPSTRVLDAPVMDEAARRRVLVDFNATTTAYPRAACVHELVEEQARRRPDATAVVAVRGGASLTYGELDARAERLAAVLQAHGVGPERAVGLCAERSVDMVVAALAILKAGGYYVPFDPQDPDERLGFLLAQVAPAAILAAAPHHARLRAFCPVVIDPAAPQPDGRRRADAPRPHPDNLVYTTYTSGSTGRPKGIGIPHRGVVRLVRDTNYMAFEADLVYLEIAPVSFDASTFELWGALTSGARLVVMPKETPSLRELGDAIQAHGVTTFYLTSALFNLMVDERVEAFAGVKQLLVGGDIISVPHAKRFLAAHPGAVLINGYGPTETTTFASCGVVSRPEDVGHSVTIGPPISNTTLYVLDRRLEPVPVGVVGDLYIGGDGNARGYFAQPALTAAAFVPHPFGDGGRLYRTGDLARWCEDGTLEFFGRRDNQVKVRGFRIELGEIETALLGHPDVKEAVVLAHDEGTAANKRLVAYLQPRPGTSLSDRELREFVARTLPDYMVPRAYVSLPALPLNVHNKVDRHVLRALGEAQAQAARATVAPRDAVEELLVLLWQEVLKRPDVGVEDSFFDVGGHSLLATQLMWRIYESFQVELPLRHLFEAPTVSHLARALRAAEPQPGRMEALARVHLKVARMDAVDVERELARRGAQDQ